jgi:hypothetical protein
MAVTPAGGRQRDLPPFAPLWNNASNGQPLRENYK